MGLSWASGLTPLGLLHLMRPLQQHFSCSESVRPVYIATGGTYLFSFRAYWATGQLIDPFGPTAAQIATFLYFLLDTHSLSPQNYQGYRFCLASFLNWTVKTAAIKDKAISKLITSVELQRPRITPVLPQWDLGIVLEALSKPHCEPLWEASFKHLIWNSVFLLAMASIGRCSKLILLVLDHI